MDFDTFWHAYPRHVAKQEARKAWDKLQPSPDLVSLMLDALWWQTKQPEWLEHDGQFVPYPASWLRGARWEDERRTTTDTKQSAQGIQYACPHQPTCINRWTCGQRQLQERRRA